MTEKHTTDLKELQKLDLRILAAKQRIVDFEPLLEEPFPEGDGLFFYT